jgi:hypothetical protein
MLTAWLNVPETRYARDGPLNFAYQIVGAEGPDLLFVPHMAFPIDLLWDEPTVAAKLRQLAGFCRLILTDPLGPTGWSLSSMRPPSTARQSSP